MPIATIKLAELSQRLGFGYRAESFQGWGGVTYYRLRPTNGLHASADSRFEDGWQWIDYIGAFRTVLSCDQQLALALSGKTLRTGNALSYKYFYGALYKVVV